MEKVKAKKTYYCECPTCGSDITYIIDNDKPIKCYDCSTEFIIDWSDIAEE